MEEEQKRSRNTKLMVISSLPNSKHKLKLSDFGKRKEDNYKIEVENERKNKIDGIFNRLYLNKVENHQTKENQLNKDEIISFSLNPPIKQKIMPRDPNLISSQYQTKESLAVSTKPAFESLIKVNTNRSISLSSLNSILQQTNEINRFRSMSTSPDKMNKFIPQEI